MMTMTPKLQLSSHPVFVWVVVLLYCVSSWTGVAAWGQVGHELVGNLAWNLLAHDVQDLIRDMLPDSSDNDNNLSPLGAVADWADQVRHTHEYFWSGPLHYIDIQDQALPSTCFSHPDDTKCYFNWPRDCPDNRCVVGALQNYTSRLVMDDPDQAAEALKFVVHFVGDLHQPLHVARSGDKGGNDIPVHAHFEKTRKYLRFPVDHSPTNLHGVWDSVLLETFQKESCNDDWTTFQEQVHQIIQDANQSGQMQEWLQCGDGGRHVCLDIWAEESWFLARTQAYVYTNGTQIQPNDVLSRPYYETNIPVVLEQLAKASVRLAWTLTFHLHKNRVHRDQQGGLGAWILQI